MAETAPTIGRTLRNLILALLNATLILVALCLFLGWRLMATVDDVSDNVTASVETVTGLREDVQALTAEVASLRETVAAIDVPRSPTSAAAQRIANRLDEFGTRLDAARAETAALRARIETVVNDPGILIDRAVDRAIVTGATQATLAIARMRGCTPPGAPVDPAPPAD